MEHYTECPALMKAQAAENKKDLYIEITDCLLAVPDKRAEDPMKYILCLKDTLVAMDPQIYELYRALSDRYVAELRACEASGLPVKEPALWEELLAFAEEKHFALREWFTKESVVSMDLSGMEEQEVKLLTLTPRSATIELVGAGKYNCTDRYEVYVNGRAVETEQTTGRSIFGLLPEREYEITVIRTDRKKGGSVKLRTARETVTLNVRDFGAVGDGVSDDTHPIQTAILNCPKEGRVLIPAGCYSITSLFLKSHIRIELAGGAELKANVSREERGYMPGVLPATDGRGEYYFGTWEGNPLLMFSGIVAGYEVEDVILYGEGTINGNASKEDWWKDPKNYIHAYRPRLFFIRDCKNIILQGLTLTNSPSWTIHPFFSDELGFYNLKVINPSDSPNTDGLDPESCRKVEIAGVKFSLGDDCIAVKSGKIYMGKKHKTPSSDVHIHHCLMENGHGAVTVGSEMAGGVRELVVEQCDFKHTDRGLRIKTRRGRGEDAVLDEIIFARIDMDHVMTPFVVNSFYFCDPDGKTDYVQSREKMPVDERTPQIQRLLFTDIEAKNCHVAAAHFDGLPEKKIEEICMERVHVTYAENPKCNVPAMSLGVEPCSLKGIFARNIHTLKLKDVVIEGQDGEMLVTENVDEVIR